MCATSPTHPDISCQIDSGSPLQYKLNNTFYVAGFASYGVACGANKPEVATRVGSFIDWIENIVCLILHEVYPQDLTSMANFSKSELACQRYQHLRENLQTLNKKCLEEKVIGGTDSDINEFPHMVAIGFDSVGIGPPYFFTCSGFLISEKFVLTAAHCVNKRLIVPRIVRLGKVIETSMNDGKDCNDAIDVNVFSKHIHKDYNLYSKHNDIALLELEDNVDQYFSFFLFPACLHHGSEPLSDLIVSSWSREIASLNSHNTDDSSQERTNWLQKVSMQEMTIENCRESLKDLEVEVAESQMCATSPTHPDISCQIHSGSPLQYKLNNTFYIAGFASYGVACGANKPEVATRVGSFIDWIENIVWP
ncbi:unnamed protein product [Diamesa hyperborea]